MCGTKQRQSTVKSAQVKSAPPTRPTPTLDFLKRSAEAGDAEAQFGLGAAYEDGLGVEGDGNMAGRWYRRASLQNNADAQMALGVLYAMGDMVPRDYSKALIWFARAADLGRKDAAELRQLVSDAT